MDHPVQAKKTLEMQKKGKVGKVATPKAGRISTTVTRRIASMRDLFFLDVS